MTARPGSGNRDPRMRRMKQRRVGRAPVSGCFRRASCVRWSTLEEIAMSTSIAALSNSGPLSNA